MRRATARKVHGRDRPCQYQYRRRRLKERWLLACGCVAFNVLYMEASGCGNVALASATLPHPLASPGYTGMLEFLPHNVSYSWHYFKVYNMKGLHVDFKTM